MAFVLNEMSHSNTGIIRHRSLVNTVEGVCTDQKSILERNWKWVSGKKGVRSVFSKLWVCTLPVVREMVSGNRQCYRSEELRWGKGSSEVVWGTCSLPTFNTLPVIQLHCRLSAKKNTNNKIKQKKS